MSIRALDLLPYKPTHYTRYMNAFVPREAVVPLVQEKTSTACSLVSPGDEVEEGQVIASSRELHGSVIHAPLPGTVTQLGYITAPDGRRVQAVTIGLKGEFSLFGKKAKEIDWRTFPSSSLRRVACDCGVVNTFGKPESLVHQMARLMKTGAPSLVVRLYDLDPSCMVDQFIAEQFPSQITEGISILAAALGTDNVVVLLPKNFLPKDDAISASGVDCVVVDTSLYPSGGKRDIINLINKQREGGRKLSLKDLFVDAATVFSLYEAVVYNKPVLDSFVQVSGHALYSDGILKVRMGTTLRALAAECGGFQTAPDKIIINGILMGNSVTGLDVPITKYVKSITFARNRELTGKVTTECIRCGRCRAVCPVGLAPDMLYGHYTFQKEISPVYLETTRLCSDCVLCNAVCPARLPLCQIIKLLRGVPHEKK